jgi:hypothetical protein
MFNIKIEGVTIDTAKLFDFGREEMDDIAQETVARYRNHVQLGGKDVFNKKFVKYTERYEKEKLAGLYPDQVPEWKKKTPNLSLTGKMMMDLQVITATEREFLVGWPTIEQARKVNYAKAPHGNVSKARIITDPRQPLPVGIWKYVINRITNILAKNLKVAIRSNN